MDVNHARDCSGGGNGWEKQKRSRKKWFRPAGREKIAPWTYSRLFFFLPSKTSLNFTWHFFFIFAMIIFCKEKVPKITMTYCVEVFILHVIDHSRLRLCLEGCLTLYCETVRFLIAGQQQRVLERKEFIGTRAQLRRCAYISASFLQTCPCHTGWYGWTPG